MRTSAAWPTSRRAQARAACCGHRATAARRACSGCSTTARSGRPTRPTAGPPASRSSSPRATASRTPRGSPSPTSRESSTPRSSGTMSSPAVRTSPARAFCGSTSPAAARPSRQPASGTWPRTSPRSPTRTPASRRSPGSRTRRWSPRASSMSRRAPRTTRRPTRTTATASSSWAWSRPGRSFAYALDSTNSTYTRVATIGTRFPSVMDLEYEPETGKLWAACDDTCFGRTIRLDVAQAGVNHGKFEIGETYERPGGAPNLNNEGFAIAPQAECVNGLKPTFYSDDSATGGHAISTGFSTAPRSPCPTPATGAGAAAVSRRPVVVRGQARRPAAREHPAGRRQDRPVGQARPQVRPQGHLLGPQDGQVRSHRHAR